MKRLRSSFLCLCFFIAVVTPVAAQFDPVGEIVLPSGSTALRWIAEKDGYAYVTTDTRLFVYDIRSLSANGPFKSFKTPLGPSTLLWSQGALRSGRYLYVFGNGLHVFDVMQPESPVEIYSVNDATIENMTKVGNFLFATGWDFLGVYQMIDPSRPILVASTKLGGRTGYAITQSGEYIYLAEAKTADHYTGMRVIHWPTKTSPLATVAEIPTTGAAYHLIVNGTYMADCRENSVHVWSLIDPEKPLEIATQNAAARAALLWGDKLVTNGRVLCWQGSRLEEYCSFSPNGSQNDPVPFGTASNAGFVYMAQQARALILTTPPTLVFPQYANGQTGSTKNRTRVILRNRGSRTATGFVLFRNASGSPASVPVGGVTQAEKPFSIPAEGTLQVLTDGTGTLTVGPVEIRSDAIADLDLEGAELFDLLGHEVSVQNAPFAKTHDAFVTKTRNENTGVAVYNPSLNVTTRVQARLLDNNGAQVAGPVSVELKPRQQLAIFTDDPALFKAYLSSVSGDFEGTLKLNVEQGAPISVVSLIQKASGALVAVPVHSDVAGQ